MIIHRSRPFSLREWLIQTRLTIYEIEDRVSYMYGELPLNDFERLVILLEDRRFLRHRGIDWRSVARVLVLVLLRPKTGGASTIEMQLVRTITRDRRVSLARKLDEMIVGRLLNFHFNKLALLRGYLRIAYFGYGIRGCEEASMRLYGKPTSILSVDEAAVVAATLVYPIPKAPSEAWRAKVRRRADYGIRLLGKIGHRLG